MPSSEYTHLSVSETQAEALALEHYGIQGKACAFIHSIVGSHDNVIGLPLALLRRMLIQVGVAV